MVGQSIILFFSSVSREEERVVVESRLSVKMNLPHRGGPVL